MRAILFLIKMMAAALAAAFCCLSIIQLFVNGADHMPIAQIAAIQWAMLGVAGVLTLVVMCIPLTWDDVTSSQWW